MTHVSTMCPVGAAVAGNLIATKLGPMLQAQKAALPSISQWTDWRWQVQNAIRDVDGLTQALPLSPEELQGAKAAVLTGFPLSITPYYLSLCDAEDTACPIRRQCVPMGLESELVQGDLVDPLGEEAHEMAPHLIQRYPDRVLLLATDRCAVYCRFCTRSRMVGNGGGARSMKALEPAFSYIEAHPEIHDVIISGGDPCVMSTSRIVALLDRLARIKHVQFLRLATRAPVTLPQRITDELCQAIRNAHPSVWLMTHFNHPKELSKEAITACNRLADAGIPLMNQSVLLRGINDDACTLAALFRALVSHRVRPYYLMQMDPVVGTSHLRTPLRRGLELMQELQGRVSGIALPKFIVDTPGGRGKVHLAPDMIVNQDRATTTLKTFRGELVDYIDPPVKDKENDG